MNVVTEAERQPAAVLIRALDPLDGVDVMRRRRSRAAKGRRAMNGRVLNAHDLCRGPGNVTMAMGITLAQNQLDLVGDQLFIEDRRLDVGGSRMERQDRDSRWDRPTLASLPTELSRCFRNDKISTTEVTEDTEELLEIFPLCPCVLRGERIFSVAPTTRPR